jgi:probable rRNA maturation factor
MQKTGKLKLTIRDLQKKIRVSPQRIKQILLKALSSERSNLTGEITVVLAGRRRIRRLNRKYLKRNAATDVLAFNLAAKENPVCADIVICPEAAVANARFYDTSPVYEVYLYAVHGLLHILGYRDNTLRQQQQMHKKATQILSQCLSIKPKR